MRSFLDEKLDKEFGERFELVIKSINSLNNMNSKRNSKKKNIN